MCLRLNGVQISFDIFAAKCFHVFSSILPIPPLSNLGWVFFGSARNTSAAFGRVYRNLLETHIVSGVQHCRENLASKMAPSLTWYLSAISIPALCFCAAPFVKSPSRAGNTCRSLGTFLIDSITSKSHWVVKGRYRVRMSTPVSVNSMGEKLTGIWK